jgi:hypothetical protein
LGWRIWGLGLYGEGEHLRERVREGVDVKEGESDVRE